jgi:hypothetical protein
MWNTILINIVLSVAIILFIHNIWDYLKTNYTTKKTKDLAEIHASKYKTIINDIIGSSSPPNKPKPTTFLSQEDQEWLKMELDEFVKSL